MNIFETCLTRKGTCPTYNHLRQTLLKLLNIDLKVLAIRKIGFLSANRGCHTLLQD